MRISGQIHKKHSGQALILTLVVLALSSVIIIPLVNMVNTGIKTTQLYQRNTKQIYAADAGIQYAMWQIKNNQTIINDRSSNTYTSYPYTLPATNNNTLNVTVTANWLFYYLFRIPNGSTPHDTSLVTTCTSSNGVFTINFYNNSQNPIVIDSMGVWLPAGFTYVNNSCSQSNFPQNIDYNNPLAQGVYGGVSLSWGNFSASIGKYATVYEQFNYSPAGSHPDGAASWVYPQQQGVGASWDNAVWWYDVISKATDTSTGKITSIDATVVYDPDNSSSSLVAYIISH